MKLQEYISALEAIQKEHGNLDVKTRIGWDLNDALGPEVRNMLKLTSRQRKQKFWQTYEPVSLQGELVVML